MFNNMGKSIRISIFIDKKMKYLKKRGINIDLEIVHFIEKRYDEEKEKERVNTMEW